MKHKNKQGFTLAEMLIVVAIIGILIAIVFPTFSNTLEKSREATDLANIRSAYALLMPAVIDNSYAEKTSSNATNKSATNLDSYIGGVYLNSGEIFTVVKISQKKAKWQNNNNSDFYYLNKDSSDQQFKIPFIDGWGPGGTGKATNAKYWTIKYSISKGEFQIRYHE